MRIERSRTVLTGAATLALLTQRACSILAVDRDATRLLRCWLEG